MNRNEQHAAVPIVPELDDRRLTDHAITQLGEVFAAYNATTNQLLQSYGTLKEEVARLTDELEHKNEQLERKSRLAALGEMAAGLAHEIRNPLGGVQLYASLLEKQLPDRPDALGWVRKISNGVRDLDALVTDVLAFAQDQQCQKATVSLRAICAEVVDSLVYDCRGGDVRIVWEHISPELCVQADAAMLRRVLLNLGRNAVAAVDRQGVVRFDGQRPVDETDYAVCITVCDTGSGIEPELLSRIFNPFFTTRDTGTGLGLAIVHRLVESHGGVISAANGPEGGAVFTILLP